MKLWTKIFSVVALAILSVSGLTALYYGKYLPRTAPPRSGSVPVTPERLERGKYIFESVAYCDGCHSERDFSRFAGPVVVAGRGKGQVFEEEGFPAKLVVANITSDKETGIGAWTDGEKIRAIREGIGRDGRTLFPLMPYSYYRSMSDYDVESLVAYLNTLAPVRNKLPRTTMPFPVSYLVRSLPKPVKKVEAPEPGRTAEYGEYLANLAHCVECHTPAEKGQLDESMKFACWRVFKFPGVSVVSANITPDPDSGIGRWSEDYFVQRFTLQRALVKNGAPQVTPDKFTLMPWLGFSQMKEDDLVAIYRYLQTQSTIPNRVARHPGQTMTAGF